MRRITASIKVVSADQLGSGIRNLFKYSRFYSGQEPQFVEGDVFWIIVPLDEAYSFDYGQTESATSATNSATNATNHEIDLKLTEEKRKFCSF